MPECGKAATSQDRSLQSQAYEISLFTLWCTIRTNRIRIEMIVDVSCMTVYQRHIILEGIFQELINRFHERFYGLSLGRNWSFSLAGATPALSRY